MSHHNYKQDADNTSDTIEDVEKSNNIANRDGFKTESADVFLIMWRHRTENKTVRLEML